MKVYYNSACPVCRAGIEESQCRLREQGAGAEVEWVDVHAEPQRVQEVGEELEWVREQLHVRGSDGSLHVGADAIAELFSQTRGRRWLAKLMRLPLIRQLARFCYDGLARGLYHWNRRKGRW